MRLLSSIAAAAVGAFMLSAAPSNAATLIPCTVDGTTIDVTNNVSPTSSCFGISGLSDGVNKTSDLNALNINGATGGWTSLGKFQNTGSNANWSIDDSVVANQEGEWDIFAAATSLYGEFMMIFKGGNSNNTLPEEFVGYIMDGTSGTWESPLRKPDGTARDLSNAELFARGAPNVIPLPASGLLLIAGLGGLAAYRRRKS